MHCWACRRDVHRFLDYGLPPRNGQCPHCGAKPRHRATMRYLSKWVLPRLEPGFEVLEVGPSRVAVGLYPRIVEDAGGRYTAIDVRCLRTRAALAPPHRFLRMDVAHLAFDARSFDVLLCTNTLPYVRDFQGALSELARCVKRAGIVLMDTHVGPGETLDVAAYRALHPHLGDDFFAENGDQWVFGADLFDHAAGAGLRVRSDSLFLAESAEFKRCNGLKPRTTVLVAFSSTAARKRFPPP